MERILSKTLLATVVLSCMAFGSAAYSTQMTPKTQLVPDGETFELMCRSMNVKNNGSEYRHELYNVAGSGERLEVRPPAAKSHTSTTRQGNSESLSVTTTFTLTATGETAGTYGCLLLPKNGSLPLNFSRKDLRKEVTVKVCSEPELQLVLSGSGPRVFNGEEKCGYRGELTWLVNGHQAPRAPRATESSPVVEREGDRLEILSTAGCGDETENSTCNVTAVFKYISANNRLDKVEQTQQIEDCCVSRFVPSEADDAADTDFTFTSFSEPRPNVVYPAHPMDVLNARPQMEAEKWELEKEVLSLQKDVLDLKKTALPLQIKFLRRLSKDHATAREMEQLGDH